MATKDEILNAVNIVDDFAGHPSVGFVRETLDDLAKSVETDTVVPDATPAVEVTPPVEVAPPVEASAPATTEDTSVTADIAGSDKGTV